jgi:S1-C subfamily serine protease
VKVSSVACDQQLNGSGWIARRGVVVTNAHVVAGSEDIRVQVEGQGPLRTARPIWYDAKADIAVLRVPGLRGVPALKMVGKAKPGTFAAVLGFPTGGQYKVGPARVGRTADIPGRKVDKSLIDRRVTSIRATVRPGNSGGPVVDGSGRVVTTVFAGQKPAHGTEGHTAYGVPVSDARVALKRAGQLADTGECGGDAGDQ